MRRSVKDLQRRAVDSFSAALEMAGLEMVEDPTGSLLVRVDDRSMDTEVRAIAYVTRTVADDLVRSGHPAGTIPVVVADRITSEARSVLSAGGWSWLDRRGRIHLVGPGVRVDMDVPVDAADDPPRTGNPLRGRSGLEIAYWLCAHPGEALSPTQHAEELGLAASTISVGVRRLMDAGLVDDSGAAYLPELFWELASVWQPSRRWLVSLPEEIAGWRTGTAAAAAYGAPVVSGDNTLELYLADEVEVAAAIRRFGLAEPGLGAAVIAGAPTPQACESGDRSIGGWPAASLLVVALDLAGDRARGREILEDWSHPDAVWR